MALFFLDTTGDDAMGGVGWVLIDCFLSELHYGYGFCMPWTKTHLL